MLGAFARLEGLVQADLEDEPPTHQKYQWVNETPDPTDGRADETLLEIAADELEEEAAPVNQIPQKQRAGYSPEHGRLNNTIFINDLQTKVYLDSQLLKLLQFHFRQSEVPNSTHRVPGNCITSSG